MIDQQMRYEGATAKRKAHSSFSYFRFAILALCLQQCFKDGAAGSGVTSNGAVMSRIFYWCKSLFAGEFPAIVLLLKLEENVLSFTAKLNLRYMQRKWIDSFELANTTKHQKRLGV